MSESDNLGARLRQHANKQDLFDWDFACVVTSKDQNLTKAHGLFLESQIIQQAMSADRVSLDNTQMHIYESIPESDISDMTYFFDQISVLLPALGIELFSPANLQQPGSSAQIRPSDQIIDDVTQSKFIERRESLQPITGSTPIDVILRDNKFGIDARGLESNGEILVLEGSRARGVNESEVNVYRQLRERLIKEGKIASTGDPRVLEFKSDVLFNSPSAASAVILDRNDNGRSTWKEINTNKSLNDWYADQANLVEQPKGESGPS
jgi:hypothetical protein